MPEEADGSIDISKALQVNTECDLSRRFWAYLVIRILPGQWGPLLTRSARVANASRTGSLATAHHQCPIPQTAATMKAVRAKTIDQGGEKAKQNEPQKPVKPHELDEEMKQPK